MSLLVELTPLASVFGAGSMHMSMLLAELPGLTSLTPSLTPLADIADMTPSLSPLQYINFEALGEFYAENAGRALMSSVLPVDQSDAVAIFISGITIIDTMYHNNRHNYTPYTD
jgi:hypothetical protein